MAEVEEPDVCAGVMNVPRRIGSHSLGEFPLKSSALNASAVVEPDLFVALSSCERSPAERHPRIYGITVDDPTCAPDAPTPDPSRMIDR
jgi:hypothetical protein